LRLLRNIEYSKKKRIKKLYFHFFIKYIHCLLTLFLLQIQLKLVYFVTNISKKHFHEIFLRFIIRDDKSG